MSTNRAEAPSADGISEAAARNTLALNPLVGIRGQDLADSAGILLKAMINEPKVATEQWFSFLAELGEIASGKSERTPKAGDRRFSDPTWKESQLHSGLLKAYLAWGDAVSHLVDKTSLSDIDKARAIYEWVVENTFCDPKVRGCGRGDIPRMKPSEAPSFGLCRAQRPDR